MAANLKVKLRKLFDRVGLPTTESRLLVNMGINYPLPTMVASGDVLQLNYELEVTRSKLRSAASGLASILHLADRGYEIQFDKAQVAETGKLFTQVGALLAELWERESSDMAPVYAQSQTKATSDGEGYYYRDRDDAYDDFGL